MSEHITRAEIAENDLIHNAEHLAELISDLEHAVNNSTHDFETSPQAAERDASELMKAINIVERIINRHS